MVSVIMPVFNGERYLDKAIKSVLDQTIVDLELIVIDDGSTDNTINLLSSIYDPRFKFYQQTNLGASNARNFGVEKSTGEYLAFLDADDLWVKNKLLLQLSEINKSGSPQMIFGLVQEFLDNSLTDLKEIDPYGDLQTGYSPITLLIKKSDFLKVGPFDERWTVAEFIDWYDRAKSIGLKDIVIQNLLAYRRIHKANVDRLKRSNIKQYVAVLKESLDRRRQNN